MEATSFESRRSLTIISLFEFIAVGHAINFDDKFPVKGDKIDDISINRMLPAKFPSR